VILESNTVGGSWSELNRLAVKEEGVGRREILLVLVLEDEEQGADEDDKYVCRLAFGRRGSAACCDGGHHGEFVFVGLCVVFESWMWGKCMVFWKSGVWKMLGDGRRRVRG